MPNIHKWFQQMWQKSKDSFDGFKNKIQLSEAYILSDTQLKQSYREDEEQ